MNYRSSKFYEFQYIFFLFIGVFYIHNNYGMDSRNLMNIQNLINDISVSNQDNVSNTSALENGALGILSSSFVQEKKTTKNNKRHCLTCDKFFNKNYYYVHLRLHTGEKPFTCKICDKGFVQGGDLTKHRRIHTREKPFKCDICNNAFALGDSLKRHEKTRRHILMIKLQQDSKTAQSLVIN